MKAKAIIPLALGLGVGLLAVKFLVSTLKRAQASNSGQTITAVRAKHDIDEYQLITAELVEQIETSDSNLIPDKERISATKDVVGRVAGKSIPQRSPILVSMLAPPGTEPDVKGRIPPGFRAVSVKIDEVTSVAYQIRPGDWVDVIVVMDMESSRGKRGKQTIAEVILQRIRVAAVGQISSTAAGEPGESKVKPAKSVTLIVAEEDVPKLHLAGTRGKITLSMRGSDEKVSDKQFVAKSDEVFKSGDDGEPQVALAPPPPSIPQATYVKPEPTYGVTVYTGLPGPAAPKAEQTIFENAASRNVISLSEGPGSQAGALFGKLRNTAEPRPRSGVPASQPRDDQATPPSKENNDASEPNDKEDE